MECKDKAASVHKNHTMNKEMLTELSTSAIYGGNWSAPILTRSYLLTGVRPSAITDMLVKGKHNTVNSVLVLQVTATCLGSLKLSQKGNNSNIRLVTML